MGHRGAPGASLYTASKHAVEGLTKSAALEAAAFGVRVNAVAPGPIETAMLDRFTGSADRKAGLVAGVPLKRAGRPEEIADAIVFAGFRQGLVRHRPDHRRQRRQDRSALTRSIVIRSVTGDTVQVGGGFDNSDLGG